jgi:uncharacterized protein DUF1206
VTAGALVVTAAVRVDPDEARGLGGTLGALQAQPYDPWLLGAVAVDLAIEASVHHKDAISRWTSRGGMDVTLWISICGAAIGHPRPETRPVRR